MTPAEQWTVLVSAIVEESAADADQAVQFVSSALQVKRKMFAFLARDRLVVKLSAARVQALIEAGDGQPYDPGTGKPQAGVPGNRGLCRRSLAVDGARGEGVRRFEAIGLEGGSALRREPIRSDGGYTTS